LPDLQIVECRKIQSSKRFGDSANILPLII
jgi:hypothetical protein